jgi:hypothetical protein
MTSNVRSRGVSLGLGLKGLICKSTNNYTTEKYKNICNILGVPGPLPDGRAPVICTGLSPPLVGNVYSLCAHKTKIYYEIYSTDMAVSRNRMVYTKWFVVNGKHERCYSRWWLYICGQWLIWVTGETSVSKRKYGGHVTRHGWDSRFFSGAGFPSTAGVFYKMTDISPPTIEGCVVMMWVH